MSLYAMVFSIFYSSQRLVTAFSINSVTGSETGNNEAEVLLIAKVLI